MPFNGERATGEALLSLEASEAMRNFRGTIAVTGDGLPPMPPQVLHVPRNHGWVPNQVIAIDGSTITTNFRSSFPNADASLLKVSLVSIDLHRLNSLRQDEIPSPALFRDMEDARTFDAIMPGANVVRRGLQDDTPTKHFRSAVHEILQSKIDNDWETLSDTLAAVERRRHDVSKVRCPIEDCDKNFHRGVGAYTCPCGSGECLFESDGLRFWERFNEAGSNGEAHGEVRHVLEVASLFNVLRYFAAQPGLFALRNTVFILDGPLAMFGHAAWLTPYFREELQRINNLCVNEGFELALFGFEKSGEFVEHFERVDFDENEGPRRVFPAGTVVAPNAGYINRCITLRPFSLKVHGQDTYFGRKILYKTQSGDHAVVTTAMANAASTDFWRNDLTCYPRLGDCLNVLDHLSTYLHRDGFLPLIRAHAQAAIPIQRGSDILRRMLTEAGSPPKASDGPAARADAAALRR